MTIPRLETEAIEYLENKAQQQHFHNEQKIWQIELDTIELITRLRSKHVIIFTYELPEWIFNDESLTCEIGACF